MRRRHRAKTPKTHHQATPQPKEHNMPTTTPTPKPRQSHAKATPKPRQSHAQTAVRVRRGSEGPRHDPYGFIEITVDHYGNRYTLHEGLACWLEVNEERLEFFGDDYANTPRVLFEEWTGCSVGRWLCIDERLHPYEEDPMGNLSDYY